VPTEGISRGRDGFTLIEILVAMVILAIGLLGLEALGIGAARSIALADRQSAYTIVATDSLESALQQLRQGAVPSQFCRSDLRFGDRLSRSVSITSGGQVAEITIRVIPNPESVNAPKNEFELQSSLYLANPIGGGASGQPCT
jgi:prepilin-type N-terminal cleavage/methylation domain-containing protein